MPVFYYLQVINICKGQTSRGFNGSSQDPAPGVHRTGGAGVGWRRVIPYGWVPLPSSHLPVAGRGRRHTMRMRRKGAPTARKGLGSSCSLHPRCQTPRGRHPSHCPCAHFTSSDIVHQFRFPFPSEGEVVPAASRPRGRVWGNRDGRSQVNRSGAGDMPGLRAKGLPQPASYTGSLSLPQTPDRDIALT